MRIAILAAACAPLALAAPAFAHPGDHMDMTDALFADHWLHSPFHVGLGAAIVIAGVFGRRALARRNARTRYKLPPGQF